MMLLVSNWSHIVKHVGMPLECSSTTGSLLQLQKIPHCTLQSLSPTDSGCPSLQALTGKGPPGLHWC